MRQPNEITILVVDDEEALRKAIIFDFKRKGFHVFEAGNGKDAFEIVKKEKIDVVLSDVRMPGGDGIELLEKIKGLSSNIPVVMLITGFADITLEDAYDKGANAMFPKPFDRKVLFDSVIRIASSKEEVWSSKENETISCDLQIELTFSTFSEAIKTRVLNIGQGGMFIALKDALPAEHTKASFAVRFEHGTPHTIEGNGIVRWIRNQDSKIEPKGCGIEFLHLNDSSRQEVLGVISSLKTHSFIPKS